VSDTDIGKENCWSDTLKQAIKPRWLIERDKSRPPGKADWRLGHMAWLMLAGSPAEFGAFEHQIGLTADRRAAVQWQEREDAQREGKPAKANAGNCER
jgi:hypothetical protein